MEKKRKKKKQSYPLVKSESVSHSVMSDPVTPWTVAQQIPLSMKFSKQEYWSGLSFPSPGDLPNPGIEPRSPVLQADSLPAEPQGKPIIYYTPIQNKKFKVLRGEKVSGNFDAAESDTMKRKWGHDHLTNVHFFSTFLHRTRW